MLTIDLLRSYGADVEGGLSRCFGNEEFYMTLVKMMPGDGSFPKLYDAIEQGDLSAAFEAAHALKGALGNLSLSPLYDSILEITELLRQRTEMDYGPLVSKIKEQRDQLEAICTD